MDPRGRVVASLAVISGCTVGPDYRKPDLGLKAPLWEAEAGRAPTATRPSTVAIGAPMAERWWSTFREPQLNRLVGLALQSNPDLETPPPGCARRGRSGGAWPAKPSAEAGESYSVTRHAGPPG